VSERPEIVRTEAVVLRTIDFGETSRIVTIFSRDRGKMGVMARGARNAKSRFGSTLEPLSHIQAIVYYRPTRELQLISEATHVQTYPGIGSSLERLEIGLRCIELVNAVQDVGHANETLFGLLVSVLSALDGAEERYENLFPFFQLRLADILGFSPSFRREHIESLAETGGYLNLSTGGIDDSAMHSSTMRASRSAIRAFAILCRAPIREVLRMVLQKNVRTEVVVLSTAYLKQHLEEAYPGRTAKVFSQFQR
jgi:DNA repair protein RecO (recombination protein O)